MLTRFDDARVVIIDDSSTVAEALAGMLRGAGLRDLHCVTDSRQALQQVDAVGPDLVLLDLHTVYVDALVLLADVMKRATGSYLPVLALTTADAIGAGNRALAQGARELLVMPFDETEALVRIGNLLELRRLHQLLRRTDIRLPASVQAQRAVEAGQDRQQDRVEHVLATLSANAFHLDLHPLVDLQSRSTVGYQARLALEFEPDGGRERWFEEAAEVGLDYALDLNTLSLAIDTLSGLPRHVFLVLRVSTRTLLHPELLAMLDRATAARIVLELMENPRVEHYGSVNRALARLRNRGVRLSLHDSGGGYVSLQHMLTLAPDIIKLDVFIVRGIGHDPVRRALATALVSFAADTHTHLVADGVQDEEDLTTLARLGVSWAQGRVFAGPHGVAQFGTDH